MFNYVRLGINTWPHDPFWVQVIEAIHQRCQECHVEPIPITRSTFGQTWTKDERTALVEEIVSQEFDVLLGWSFPESLAVSVLDKGIPIVHLSETVIDHPLNISPIGLETISEELGHHLAQLVNCKGHILVI